MRTEIAMLAAATIIVAVVLFLFRYEITTGQQGTFRMNRLTGAIEQCARKTGATAISCQ
jgi:hypothetical protein